MCVYKCYVHAVKYLEHFLSFYLRPITVFFVRVGLHKSLTFSIPNPLQHIYSTFVSLTVSKC